MARKKTLDEAIAAAASDTPARAARKVRPMSKRGRPQSDTSPSKPQAIHGPSEIADMLGYQRDAVYEWEKKGLERALGGKGFHLPDVVRWLMARERAAGRLEADPDDALQAEQLRDLRARADMREDQRDLQRKQLIEVELAVAVYEDDTAYVAVHLRNLGARLMGTLCTMDDPAEICAVIDGEVERALENLNSAHVDPASPDAHPIVGGVMIEGRG